MPGASSYGAVLQAEGGRPRNVGRRRAAVMMAAVATTAVAALGMVAYSASQGSEGGAIPSSLVGGAGGRRAARTTQLADPGYVDWLKTLKGPGDYQTGDEYDDKFDGGGMPHMDVTHLVHSALPGSKVVAGMDGSDFALDVTSKMAAPVNRDEINQLPMKLQELEKRMAKEKTAVSELQGYVNAHALAQPESLVVHVGQRGPRGAQGARGPRGPVGDQGTKGDTGPRGPPGNKGRTGSQGPQGATGKKGPLGAPGADGFPGAPGPRGAIGFEGPEGPPGAKGPDGSTGPPGMQGPNGGNGLEGETGLTGMQGADGDRATLTCAKVVGRVCFSGAHGQTSYNGAKGACRRHGGTVMTFGNEEELKIGESIFGSRGFYVGYQKLQGAWKFADGRSNGYANQQWGGGSGDCAKIENHKMYKTSCNSHLPYLCTFVIPKSASIV